MSKLELLAAGKMINSSEAMFDRRRRILREARRIMLRDGLDSFNMRELGRQADVSTRTIYNAFGSKEMVVALAIHAYFETFVANVQFTEEADSFDGALARQSTSTLRDLDVRHYMKALVSLYFSLTIHPDIRDVLVDVASRSWVPWLQRLKSLRQIGKGVDVPDLIVELANVQYARLHEWCIGGLDDEAFLSKTMSDILLLLVGATKGSARVTANTAFVQMQSATAFRRQLLANARERITAMEANARNRKITGANASESLPVAPRGRKRRNAAA